MRPASTGSELMGFGICSGHRPHRERWWEQPDAHDFGSDLCVPKFVQANSSGPVRTRAADQARIADDGDRPRA
jgi:hypothetical protein